MHAVLPRLDAIRTSFPALRRRSVSTLQVNLGYKCNQSCVHCHVAASPQRTEMMDAETIDLVIDTLKHTGARTLDLTGGAPELNPYFRGYGQQDSQEFLRCMLDNLHEELREEVPLAPPPPEIGNGNGHAGRGSEEPRTRFRSIVSDTFEGTLLSEVRCQNCGVGRFSRGFQAQSAISRNDRRVAMEAGARLRSLRDTLCHFLIV